MTRRRPSRAQRVAAAALGLGALLVAPTVAGAGQTEAAWTNSEYARTSVAAGVVSAPTPGGNCSTGVLGGAVYRFQLPPAGGLPRGGFVIGLYQNGNLVAERVDTDPNAVSAAAGTLLGTLLGGTYQVRVSAYLQGNSAWRSAPLYGTLTAGLLGINPVCGNAPMRTTPP